MAKEAYYFSHDSNARNDIKLVQLRRKSGLDGLGIYWCIVEMLRESAGYILPIDSIDDIAYDIKTSPEKVHDVILNYGLFDVNTTHFFSRRLTRSMSEYERISDKRREAGKLGGTASARKRSSKRQANVNDCSSIKGKEIKEKEINTPLPPKGVSEILAQVIPEWQNDFEWFWEAYGKKADRSKCERKFKNLSQAERDSIRVHVPEYVASTPNTQYRKNPLTYLNGKCWNDEIFNPATAKQTKMVY